MLRWDTSLTFKGTGNIVASEVRTQEAAEQIPPENPHRRNADDDAERTRDTAL